MNSMDWIHRLEINLFLIRAFCCSSSGLRILRPLETENNSLQSLERMAKTRLWKSGSLAIRVLLPAQNKNVCENDFKILSNFLTIKTMFFGFLGNWVTESFKRFAKLTRNSLFLKHCRTVRLWLNQRKIPFWQSEMFWFERFDGRTFVGDTAIVY